jgi:lipopolysaccharide heptosyltransferase II
MNILQILPELNVGGVETGTVDLARALTAQGHKAVVISRGGALVKELEACGAVHYALPVHKKNLLVMFRMVDAVADIIRKEQIDIVHARSRVPAWPAFFACRKTRAVFITTCHGYYSRHLFSAVMGWGKRVIVLSNAIARHMIDDFGVPHERIRRIARSVRLDKFTYEDPAKKRTAEFNVGIIGRITPLKGHLVFIKAMAKLAKQVPGLKIWIVGDAPASKEAYKEQLLILVKRLGLFSQTQFLGTQRDIPGVLSHLDALVLATTTQEAFGRVIIEAQASGVPVVATKVGGVVDVVDDGVTGLLVPPDDPQAIAESLHRIYADSSFASRMAAQAYEKVKQCFTLERMVDETLQVYKDALSRFRILVIKLSSLGDVILATAALRALREKFGPNYRISVLVGEGAKDVLLRCPYIDELIVCDLKGRQAGWTEFLRLAARVRRQGFEMVFDMQNNRASHLLAWLSMAPERFGYRNAKLGFLLNRGIPEDKKAMDPLAHQFRVFAQIGIMPKDNSLQMWPGRDDDEYVEEMLKGQWLSDHQKLIGINVSASKRWATKNWPRRMLVEFCEEVARKGWRVVLTGTAEDLPESLALANEVRQAKPINTCGQTSVNQLACLIRRCHCFVSTDSAPLHIAAAMGTPFVALFGPTDPARHLPPAKRCAVVRKEVPCGPCYKDSCSRMECMRQISVAEVMQAVEKLV